VAQEGRGAGWAARGGRRESRRKYGGRGDVGRARACAALRACASSPRGSRSANHSKDDAARAPCAPRRREPRAHIHPACTARVTAVVRPRPWQDGSNDMMSDYESDDVSDDGADSVSFRAAETHRRRPRASVCPPRAGDATAHRVRCLHPGAAR